METGTKQQASDETVLQDGERMVVKTDNRGTLFIEARIHDDVEEEMDSAEMQKDLQDQLSRPNQFFDLFANLLTNEQDAKRLLGPLHKYSHILQSLRVVEYIGPQSELNTYSSNDVKINVQAYKLYRAQGSPEEQEGLPQADITPLPHMKFDGQWDTLCFETDIKSKLIWMMTNMLRFSQTSGRDSGDTNPLILLYGPPGTGKTTLCQGLAQKISIRLNTKYVKTRLIQIKAAALLSKYYSESARQVDKIFTTLQQMCEENTKEFICVLIDEVETIAITREASANGESQESLRATNAFLTGLDRTKGYPNIVILCTSNMLGSLDSAFLDRCGLKHAVEVPSLISQYAILRGRVQKLINRRIILSATELPTYRDANADRTLDPELPGSKLLKIIELLGSATPEHPERTISGRSLSQLPEQALLRYLRGEDCDLNMALVFMKQYAMEEQSRAMTKNPKVETDYTAIERRSLASGGVSRKRTVDNRSEEDKDIDRALLDRMLGTMGDLIAAELRKRRILPSQ